MPFPPLLQRVAKGKLLVEQRGICYGTLQRTLDESVQFQLVLHGIICKTLQEGEQQLISIYKASILEEIPKTPFLYRCLELIGPQLVLAANFMSLARICERGTIWKHITPITINIEPFYFPITLT